MTESDPILETLQKYHAHLLDWARSFRDKALTNPDVDTEAELKEFTKVHSRELYKVLRVCMANHTARLQNRVNELVRENEAARSDNIFLEYKKKDLLQLTSELESANEEISKQADELKNIHDLLLEKNSELELQKEALLDQADYLYESNETIIQMHAQVEKQHQEILAVNQELHNLNHEKNNLIGIVAHDLKSPLNQIRGLISLAKLSTEKLDPEVASLISMMESSVERLVGMIGKILDVEAIESKTLNLSLQEVDLTTLLQTVAGRFENEAAEKMITLEYDLQSDVHVNADAGYADQVLQNLISNAIKFSPYEKCVHICLSTREQMAVVEIRDQGPGLSEEDKTKLFAKYQKLSARPTGNETSTGLGLSIVKKYVDAMGGRIWCESEQGQGASFFVSFKCT